MLNDQAGGMRKTGLSETNAESLDSTNTEDMAGLEALNCSAMGMLMVGAEDLDTQKEKVEEADAELLESFADTAISGWPSSLSDGVPENVREAASNVSQSGREAAA